MKAGTLERLKFNKSNRFFLVLCIPVVLVVLFLCLSGSYYMRNHRENLISVYVNEFNQFLKSIEDTLNSVIMDNSTYIANTDIRHIVNGSVKAEELDRTTLNEVKNVLLNIEKQSRIIDSIAVVNRKNGFVVTANGIYNMNSYFERSYAYSEYPVEYWINYVTSKDHSRILRSTEIKAAGSSRVKTVTPVVFGAYDSNMVIYNFDSEKLYDFFRTYCFTSNSSFYMRSAFGGDYITDDENKNLIDDLKFKEGLTKFSTNYCVVDKVESDGKNYYCINTTDRAEFFGYEYSVLIPFSDLNDYTHPIFMNLMYYILAALLLLMMYTAFGTYFFYSPWRMLAKRISGRKSGTSDEYVDLKNITDAISNIISENTDLNKDLSKALSYSQQKYVTDIMNNASDGADEEMNRLIFKNEYFISVVISVSVDLPISLAMSDGVGDRMLMTELFRTLKSIFETDFATFSIPSAGSYMYLLLNVSDENDKERVGEKIDEICSLLEEDKNYIDIYFGVGDVHKGIKGLKQTHGEALSRIHSKISSERVDVEGTLLAGTDITANIENILTNYIVAGYDEQCITYLKNIFRHCAKLSYQQCQQIYITIICVLYKITEVKGKSCSDVFDGKSELELLNETLNLSADEIQKTIFGIVNRIIGDSGDVLNKNLDIARVAEYIEKHYDEDLYLNNLADKFNISPKYLSKKINQYLGTPFKTYLTQLRINKAEEMLKEGDVKISEIYMQVGFYNRSTFIRTFKQKTGLTPSEYRALYKRNENGEETDEQ